MPVKNFGTDIIQAYLAGLQERRAKETTQRKLELETAEQEERKRQFNEQLKQQKAQWDAQFEVSKALNKLKYQKQLADIQKNAVETGLPIPGAKETLVPTTTTQQNFEMLNQGTWNRPNLDEVQIQTPEMRRQIDLPTGESLNVPDPFTYRRQQAELAGISLRPGEESKIRTAVGIAKGTTPLKMELETVKGQQRRLLEQEKNVARTELQKQKDAAAYQRVTDAANIRARAAAQKGGVKNRLLNDKEILGIEGAKVGDTVFDHIGAVLRKEISPTERAKLDSYEELEKELTILKDYGDKGLYNLTEPITGTVRNIAAKFGVGTEEEENFRQTLAGVKKTLVTISAGKTLTKNEEKLVNRYVPDIGSGPLKTKVAVDKLTDLFQRAQDRIKFPTATHKAAPSQSSGVMRKTITDPKDRSKKLTVISRDKGVTWEEE